MEYRLVLVEDERWVRVALRKVIEKLELPLRVVYEASNGLDASDWLLTCEADLVLTDIRMPVMDGLTLLQELKERDSVADVVMISGHNDFSYAQQAMRQGAFDYLLKPVEQDDLTKCFHNWMRRRERKSEGLPTHSGTVQVEELSPVEQVIHYIRSSQTYDMSSAEAAERVCLNPSYFSKLFKQTKGMTFTDFVTSIRMEEAARLLLRTSLRMSEIAGRVGYTDPAYFTNTFKKVKGIAPSEYRKQQLTSSSEFHHGD